MGFDPTRRSCGSPRSDVWLLLVAGGLLLAAVLWATGVL